MKIKGDKGHIHTTSKGTNFISEIGIYLKENDDTRAISFVAK